MSSRLGKENFCLISKAALYQRKGAAPRLHNKQMKNTARGQANEQQAIYWLRLLGGQKPRPLASLPAAAAHALPMLRDDYGAVVESDDGWRRAYPIQWLREKKLAPVLGNVVVAEETESTNQMARHFAPPFFIFAEHQHTGRGSRDRRWLSLPGNALLMSAVLPLPRAAAALGGLSVAVGAALWRALSADQRLRLKWPNDLLDAAGNKVGGILVELSGNKLIIGVGLNLIMTPPLAARINRLGGLPPGALNNIIPLTRQRAAVLLAQTVAAAVAAFSQHGFDAFQEMARAAHIAAAGDVIRFKDGHCAPFAGFDGDGALLTGGDGGLSRHTVAELSYVACH